MEHLSFNDGKFDLTFLFVYFFISGTQFKVFLDAGYRIGHSMITPFRARRDMSREELEWNRYKKQIPKVVFQLFPLLNKLKWLLFWLLCDPDIAPLTHQDQ